MGYLQMSFVRPVPDEWQGLSDDDFNSQMTGIFEIVEQNGGDMKVNAFSPSHNTYVSVVEYPDSKAAQRAVAQIAAQGYLEFESIHPLWDGNELTTVMREAQMG